MKKRYIAIAGILILFLLIGMSSDNSTDTRISKQTTPPEQQTPPIQTTKKIVTPVPIEENRQITVSYTSEQSNKIGDYSEAPIGKVFLIVTMTIKNNGYDEFNLNPNYFSIIIDSIKYNYASETFSLPNKLDSSAEILDGGSITGSMAFIIPTGATEYKLQYSRDYKDYNIVYN